MRADDIRPYKDHEVLGYTCLVICKLKTKDRERKSQIAFL
jgi:hypothetical protein